MRIQERAPDQKQISKVAQQLELSAEQVEELGRFADPDPNWKNGQWILKQFSKGNVDPQDTEVLDTLSSAIEKFEKAKVVKGLKGNEANIDSYKTAQDLVAKVNSLPPEAFISQRSIKKRKADPLAMKGSELVASDDNWRIYHLTSKNTMSIHGGGTEWCTRVRGGEYQCRYLGRGGTYVVYLSDNHRQEIHNKLAAEGLEGWEKLVPDVVPSKSMPGWSVFGQFTPNLSEFRDVHNTSISNRWMKEFGSDLDAMIDNLPEVSAKKPEEPEELEGDIPVEQMEQELGEETVERLRWAFNRGVGIVDEEGDNLRDYETALRYRHGGEAGVMVTYVECPELAGDSILSQSNKRSFVRNYSDQRDPDGTTSVWQVGEGGDVLVSLGAPDEVWGSMKHLHDDYPVFDDEDFSELEQEKAYEDWTNYQADEFKRTLAKRFTGLSDTEKRKKYWTELFAKTPESDKELSQDDREFLVGVVDDMDPSSLYELARAIDDNFPEIHDEGENIIFENNFEDMAMQAPVEDIVRSVIGDDLDNLFDGDAAAFVHFHGDYGDYQNWRAEQQAQSRLFPTGEPEHLMGPTMYPGESVTEDTHSYATTQAVPPEEVCALVQSARDQIDRDDLDPDEGFGPDPHVTILYGLGDDQEREATEILKKAGPLQAKVAALDTFETDDYDVVIFRLESDAMQKLHDELDDLPNDNQWPEYKPHMTVAYVQPGLGQKYVDELESDLVGQNFVANQVEFSNTADDRVLVDLREGTTEAFENLSEQSPLFGTDVLTEEPDESQILGALYPVLNRTNRRAVSINSAAGDTSVLLDNGASLDMTMRDGSWWATTGRGDYDLLSPTDQERLVKELNGMLEAVLEDMLVETTATIMQDGYDLVIKFSGYPTTTEAPSTPSEPTKPLSPRKRKERYSIYSPQQMTAPRKPRKKKEPEAGFESVQEQEGKRFDYIDMILPILQRDPEFAQLGEFKRHTIDSIRFVPHYRNWDDVKSAADRVQHLLSYAGASTGAPADQIDTVTGVTRGEQIDTSGGGLLGPGATGGTKSMTWRERGRRMIGRGPTLQPPGEYRQRAAQPAAAPIPAPEPASPPATAQPSFARRAAGGIKKAAVSSYQRAKKALTRKPAVPTPPVAPGRGQSVRPPGALTAPAIPGRGAAQAAMKQKWKKQGPVGAEEDTYTSDVSSTDTIPITRPTKKRRRGSVKIPGIKDASRRRVTRTYRVMGESMSKASQPGRVGEPIRVVMRPSQVEALGKKPVWSALSESGVIMATPFKMGQEEFFEVKIDTMRREWNEANTSTLLDEVGSVAPQAHRKILERSDPEIAAKAIVNLIKEILEAQAEAEIEDGPCGTVADWIRSQKLQGREIGTAELAEHLQGSVDTVRELLEDFPLDQKVLEYLKSVDGSVGKAASLLIEDERTSSGANLGAMADPGGAALGSVIQGYGEQGEEPPPEELPPETPTDVAVSSRTWAPEAMFKLHIQRPDGTSEWVHRTVVGHEGEGEGSALIYKDEGGNIMRLTHDQIDQGLGMKAVMSPDEMGVESSAEIPAEVGAPVAEPIGEQGEDPEAEKLNRDSAFTKALTAYQQSKSENDWNMVREAAQRIIGKTGPDLDRLLGQYAGQPAEQPMEHAVNDEVRTRVTEDKEVTRYLRRFQMTQNEAYLLRATDRAVRLGAPTHSRARRLVDELAGAAV